MMTPYDRLVKIGTNCSDHMTKMATMPNGKNLNIFTGTKGQWTRGFSVRVYTVVITKYATKIVGTQKRQVACKIKSSQLSTHFSQLNSEES